MDKSGKYYIDDHEESVREIDLIAYKVGHVQDFSVFTALVISCKKNESNVWAFLSRSMNKQDPNRKWHPFHAWTNEEVLRYQVSGDSFASDYHARAEKENLEILGDPEFDIFAFQEMSQQTGTAQNDKAIFSSITSLMKAQAYEIRALPERKSQPCIYHFWLLSVVDAEMIRLLFKGTNVRAFKLDSEQYLASYIINKKQDVSRIRFVRASALDKAIPEYEKLHGFNCSAFSELYDDFFKDVLKNPAKIGVRIDEFRRAVRFEIYLVVWRNFKKDVKLESIELYWLDVSDAVAVGVPLGDEELSVLNLDEELNAIVAKALAEIYRYHGSFSFEEPEIPF